MAWRLSLFYGSTFTVAGLHMPYWPVWLDAVGQGPAEIGILLAAGVWARMLANPLVAHLADRAGERRRPMVILAWGSLLGFAAFAVVDGFWALLAVSILFGLLWAPIVPLGESLTVLTAYAERLDYGRIRVWGSISFMFAAVLGGWWLDAGAAPVIYGMLTAALLGNALVCLLVPDLRVTVDRRRGAPFGRLLRQPLFLLFLLGGSLVQSSHAVYYGFSSLHWRGAGLSESTIGLLWAEGVVAEILLFVFSAAALRRFGATGLLLIAAAAAALRWTLTAGTTGLGPLLALQALHALTFGAAHLGAIHFIARAVAPGLSATAQSLYSATTGGLALGLSLIFAGPLYARFAGGAFYAMAITATIGGVACVYLALKWKGEQIDA